MSFIVLIFTIPLLTYNESSSKTMIIAVIPMCL